MTTHDLRRALDAIGELLATVRDPEWAAPTPCVHWCVRDLVGHLIAVNRSFAGAPAAPDPLPDNPLAAYQDSAEALLARLDATPAPPDRLELRLADLAAHSWDLSRALDRPVALPDEVVTRALAFARSDRFAEFSGDRDRFAERQPVPPDATPLDRLAALAGRSADWAG